MTELALTEHDLFFLQVLKEKHSGAVVGTGCLPRCMTGRRAAELRRAGLVTAEPHEFFDFGPYPGLKYEITKLGLAELEMRRARCT